MALTGLTEGPSCDGACSLWRKEKADQAQQEVQEVHAKEQDLHLETNELISLEQDIGKVLEA